MQRLSKVFWIANQNKKSVTRHLFFDRIRLFFIFGTSVAIARSDERLPAQTGKRNTNVNLVQRLKAEKRQLKLCSLLIIFKISVKLKKKQPNTCDNWFMLKMHIFFLQLVYNNATTAGSNLIPNQVSFYCPVPVKGGSFYMIVIKPSQPCSEMLLFAKNKTCNGDKRHVRDLRVSRNEAECWFPMQVVAHQQVNKQWPLQLWYQIKLLIDKKT